MSRCAKAIHAEPLPRFDAAEAQRPVPDDAGAEQGGGLLVREDTRDRIGEALGDNGVLGIPAVAADHGGDRRAEAVDVEAAELGAVGARADADRGERGGVEGRAADEQAVARALGRPEVASVLVPAERGTTKLLKVELPKRLEKVLLVQNNDTRSQGRLQQGTRELQIVPAHGSGHPWSRGYLVREGGDVAAADVGRKTRTMWLPKTAEPEVSLALALLVPLTAGCGKTVGETIDDTTITTRVKTSMLNDPAVGGLRIDVDTFKGVVTLSGRVKTQAEKEQALTLARRTQGVVEVKDALQVIPEGQP